MAKRNRMWLTADRIKCGNTCQDPEAFATCANKECEDYEASSEFGAEEFGTAAWKDFVCERCGGAVEYVLQDKHTPITCRCFSAIIAKKEIRFCMLICLCGFCLAPHFARPCLVAGKDDHCCEQTKNWRIYLPHAFDCENDVFPMPSPGTCVVVPMRKGC